MLPPQPGAGGLDNACKCVMSTAQPDLALRAVGEQCFCLPELSIRAQKQQNRIQPLSQHIPKLAHQFQHPPTPRPCAHVLGVETDVETDETALSVHLCVPADSCLNRDILVTWSHRRAVSVCGTEGSGMSVSQLPPHPCPRDTHLLDKALCERHRLRLIATAHRQVTQLAQRKQSLELRRLQGLGT